MEKLIGNFGAIKTNLLWSNGGFWCSENKKKWFFLSLGSENLVFLVFGKQKYRFPVVMIENLRFPLKYQWKKKISDELRIEMSRFVEISHERHPNLFAKLPKSLSMIELNKTSTLLKCVWSSTKCYECEILLQFTGYHNFSLYLMKLRWCFHFALWAMLEKRHRVETIW